MFSSIGWGEFVVLALAALFIFGPDRLPDLAKDAAGGLKRVKTAVTGARGQLHDSLGEDFDHLRDLDLRKYHPRTFVRDALLGEEEPLHRDDRRSSDGASIPRTASGDTGRPG